MTDEQEDPREHIDDSEWLWQHGYLDGTLYAFGRLLQQLAHDILEASGLLRVYDWLTRRLGR